MSVLLHTMASPSAVEYLDNVLDALKKYCKMLSATEQLDASISLFTNELLKFLQHEDSSVRRNVYLVSNSVGSGSATSKFSCSF